MEQMISIIDVVIIIWNRMLAAVSFHFEIDAEKIEARKKVDGLFQQIEMSGEHVEIRISNKEIIYYSNRICTMINRIEIIAYVNVV